MNFHAGDTVMHWTHGLGKIIRREKRDVLGHAALYYAVQVGDMVVWVPMDEKVAQRLRRPTPRTRFKRLISLLAKPGDTLPKDRHERKLLLSEYLKDGSAEALVHVIRCLLAQKQVRALNDHDQAVLHRVQTALLAEWGYVLSLTPIQAELQMQQLLRNTPDV